MLDSMIQSLIQFNIIDKVNPVEANRPTEDQVKHFYRLHFLSQIITKKVSYHMNPIRVTNTKEVNIEE